MIPPDDRGFTLGDGVFETVRAEGRSLWMWRAHVSRLGRSAALLDLPAPDEAEALRAAETALAGVEAERSAVRISWSMGSGGRGLDRPARPEPRLLATAAPSLKPAGPARLIWASAPRNERSPLSRCKSLAYLDNVLARAEARAGGADEALLVNTAGEVAGAAAANVFWLADGRLYTPALGCGCLDGVMRGLVLQAASELGLEARDVRARAPDVEAADAIFLTNVLIGLRPAYFEPSPSASPVIARLAEAAERLSRTSR